MIALDSPIVGTGGTVADALAFLVGPDDQDVAYVNELFRICQSRPLDFRVAFAQFCIETADGTSTRWLTNRNPAGLAVTQPSDPDPARFTGIEAARVHGFALYHATNRGDALNPLVPASALAFLQRWEAKYRDPNCPLVKTVADLCRHYTDSHGEHQATWAWDETYSAQICAKANAIFRENAMSVYPVVGLPGPGIELPVPLAHQIIDLSQTNQRPGIKRQTPGYWVQHETANPAPGADAQMHSNWLHNGAGGAQLSFHFAVDDGIVIQLIPIDEVTWQAADGAGPGNMSGISCELCVNADGDEAKARANAEALCAGICRALGLGPDRVKRHYDFNAADPNRHHCPDHMMTEGYWPTFVAHVGLIVSGIAEPKPEFVPAHLPDWWARSIESKSPSDAEFEGVLWRVARRKVTANHDTYRYPRPDIHSGPPYSGRPIPAGTKVQIERVGIVDGTPWLLEQSGNYLYAGRFKPSIKIG